MQLSFRRRVFIGVVGIGTLPLAVALILLALQVRSTGSQAGPRAAIDEIAESGRSLMAAVDTVELPEEASAALQAHAEVVAQRTTLVRRAETLTRYAAAALGFAILGVTLILILASLGFARRWSRYVSSPIEELVEWVRTIERGESLPPSDQEGAAPEFDALRRALHEMSYAVEHARRQELDQERLRAFRETARRVAHEMRGPLTAARLAIRQLKPAHDTETVEVLEEETDRLERMAQEFSDFGRLPEGPEADVDLVELVRDVVTGIAPTQMPVQIDVPPSVTVRGHYEPLRRAIQNLVRNAFEATDRRGIHIAIASVNGTIRIVVRDHGPGVPPSLRERIFEPYFTTKKQGTGLGLALARQTVEAHGGNLCVEDADGGGARFVMAIAESE
jgi:signal transduction histidine kinase